MSDVALTSVPRRYRRRLWSLRHAAGLERLYDIFERSLRASAPAFRTIGYDNLERPVAFVERQVKGALFDCKMCGDCLLSSTGMSCPTNCPKGLRNGPCGGVRANGNCEVVADMPCVWVKAWEGSRLMSDPTRIAEIEPPLDHRLKGHSSWLAVAREGNEARP
jgi:hypothetical protein